MNVSPACSSQDSANGRLVNVEHFGDVLCCHPLCAQSEHRRDYFLVHTGPAMILAPSRSPMPGPVSSVFLRASPLEIFWGVIVSAAVEVPDLCSGKRCRAMKSLADQSMHCGGISFIAEPSLKADIAGIKGCAFHDPRRVIVGKDDSASNAPTRRRLVTRQTWDGFPDLRHLPSPNITNSFGACLQYLEQA